MKSGYFSIVGCCMLMLLWPVSVAATNLSGKIRLTNQDILITGVQKNQPQKNQPQKYKGQIDLRSQLPMGDEFVLTKVTVTFKFQDDKEWVRKPGKASLNNTGKITRHPGSALRKKSIAGQTNLHYTMENLIEMSNEQEVAELHIGRNRFYGTTMRRRDATREILGQKKMMLGIYPDAGDGGRIRQHYRITEEIRQTRRDGHDGLFEIRHKSLDLSAMQDIARTGMLNFELAGEGDYIFLEARVAYEGHMLGQTVSQEGGLFDGMIWLAMGGLPLGGLIWWKKRHAAVRIRRRALGRRNPAAAV